MVSRHCAGLLIPSSSTINELAKTLSATQAVPLVVAYLQDHCPLHLRSQIQIQAKPQSGKVQVKENLKIDLARFPMHQRTVIQRFINIVTTDSRTTELMDVLIKYYNNK